jgi:hypothetical protein
LIGLFTWEVYNRSQHGGGVRFSEWLGVQPLTSPLRPPSAMEATKYRYGVAVDHEVDQIRKPSDHGPPDVAMHLRVKARVTDNPAEKIVDD